MSRQRPHVVYWNHSPTPYFVERFNALSQREEIDFEAWFNERREPIRSWSVDESDWQFPARYIPCRSLLGWQARVPVAELRATRPDVLVQEYDRSHLTAGFLAGRALARRTAFRTLPNFDSWSERTWWRELGKGFVFRAVDSAKVPGSDGRALAERYGLDAERIEAVTQSVDAERLAGSSDIGAHERCKSLREMGLGGCVFLYAGRLWVGKGVEDLLSAYEGVVQSGVDVSLLLLGDGPDEDRFRARCADLPRVHFAGFIQPAQIARYYGLADVMVFPTLGDPHGLVVEEAMAAGLPVISTSSAGDISKRLPDGEAGFIVAPHDPGALQARMLALAVDQDLRARMGKRASELAAQRSHRRYAEDFVAFIAATLARAPRQGGAVLGARALGAALAFAGRRQRPSPLLTGTRAATVHAHLPDIVGNL